jgi:hypothetical protein
VNRDEAKTRFLPADDQIRFEYAMARWMYVTTACTFTLSNMADPTWRHWSLRIGSEPKDISQISGRFRRHSQRSPASSSWSNESEAVTIDQIRTLYDAQPFQPFIIHLADGRQIPVEHRELIARAPSGRTVVVYGTDDAAHVIDLLLITDLEIKPAKNGSRKRRRG